MNGKNKFGYVVYAMSATAAEQDEGGGGSGTDQSQTFTPKMSQEAANQSCHTCGREMLQPKRSQRLHVPRQCFQCLSGKKPHTTAVVVPNEGMDVEKNNADEDKEEDVGEGDGDGGVHKDDDESFSMSDGRATDGGEDQEQEGGGGAVEKDKGDGRDNGGGTDDADEDAVVEDEGGAGSMMNDKVSRNDVVNAPVKKRVRRSNSDEITFPGLMPNLSTYGKDLEPILQHNDAEKKKKAEEDDDDEETETANDGSSMGPEAQSPRAHSTPKSTSFRGSLSQPTPSKIATKHGQSHRELWRTVSRNVVHVSHLNPIAGNAFERAGGTGEAARALAAVAAVSHGIVNPEAAAEAAAAADNVLKKHKRQEAAKINQRKRRDEEAETSARERSQAVLNASGVKGRAKLGIEHMSENPQIGRLRKNPTENVNILHRDPLPEMEEVEYNPHKTGREIHYTSTGKSKHDGSRQEGQKLHYQGHDFYFEKYKSKEGKYNYFYCKWRKKAKCSAILKIDWADKYKIVEYKDTHGHDADECVSSADYLRAKLRETAKNDKGSACMVLVGDIISRAPVEVATLLPSEESMKKYIRAYRYKVHGAAVPIPLTLQFEYRPEDKPYIIYDEHKDTDRRITIFASDIVTDMFMWGYKQCEEERKELIRLGADPNRAEVTWISDGTFETCPFKYQQMYTVHGLIGEGFPPLMYALTGRKDGPTYEELFAVVKRIAGYEPTRMMMDYEKSARNGFTSQFPNTTMSGCWFHSCQCVYKRIQHEGLQPLYKENDTFRKDARCLSALAFVPYNHVEDGLNFIEDQIMKQRQYFNEKVQHLLNYFRATWVGSGRLRPDFPIPEWNHYESAIQMAKKTSNDSEGWHVKMKNHLGSQLSQKSPWKMIDGIKRDIHMVRAMYYKTMAGGGYSRKNSKYLKVAQKLSTIVHGYDKVGRNDLGKYLRACAAANVPIFEELSEKEIDEIEMQHVPRPEDETNPANQGASSAEPPQAGTSQSTSA